MKNSRASPRTNGFPHEAKDLPGFSAVDFHRYRRYYAGRMAFGATAGNRVGWGSEESQRARFEMFTSIAPLSGTKVLDLGCGLGAFCGYLAQRGLRTGYTGVELFEPMTRAARGLNPAGRFETRDILSKPFPPRSFDYAFLSGLFNVKVRDNWKYMRVLLTEVLREVKRGLAFNVLHGEAALREGDRFTASPKELHAFASRLGAGRVKLLDHYHPNDVTVFLYK